MNFAREVVDRADPAAVGLVELGRDGTRVEWTFGRLARASAALAGNLAAGGVGRGDTVVTVIGNRPQWVIAMVACFRIGAVAVPCNEQLRAGDLRLRLALTRPAAILADERNSVELAAAEPDCRVLWCDDADLYAGPPATPVELEPTDPCLIVFTSGTSGEPKAAVHGQRYLRGQELQARAWLAARPGELVWCTAASGWSKSARNVFVAPWLCGASALVHDGRFDPHERVELVAREGVNVLCMAPTEYRLIAARATLSRLPALRGMVAAGEALNPEVLRAWLEATGTAIRDGYGQTETGQLTAMPLGEAVRPGSMGRALPGVGLSIDGGELVVDPASVPTFFLHYLGEPPPAGPWRTGDRVSRDAEGYLHFEGRTDDLIISAGYRIGPFEVESALVAHPAVAEAAVVAFPDLERGSVVRAVVVLRAGERPSASLARALQEHCRSVTAPYKYPRIVDFVEALPTTPSGKIRRAELRRQGSAGPDSPSGVRE
ncbi:MAG: acetyl-CoA synthetase [Solirubrobacteraceae bacterium]|nr:acetyl-CoA synthetase [Solirubrobacteraceae bacterium]